MPNPLFVINSTKELPQMDQKKMKSAMAKPINFLVLALLLLFVVLGFEAVDGAGECGRSPPDREAIKLSPCAMAAQDQSAQVSSACCARIKQMGQNPKCLCAVMLSNTAKSSGAKPEIAVTIPKRCNIADRPVGYKCGAYTLP